MVSYFSSPSSPSSDRRLRDRTVPAIPAFPRAAHGSGQRWRQDNRRSPKIHRNLPVGRPVPLQGTADMSPWDRAAESPRKEPRAANRPRSRTRISTGFAWPTSAAGCSEQPAASPRSPCRSRRRPGPVGCTARRRSQIGASGNSTSRTQLGYTHEGRSACNREPEFAARSPV